MIRRSLKGENGCLSGAFNFNVVFARKHEGSHMNSAHAGVNGLHNKAAAHVDRDVTYGASGGNSDPGTNYAVACTHDDITDL